MDENNLKYRKRDSGNAGRCTKSRSKKNYFHKQKCHGKEKKECDENNKNDLEVQNTFNKIIFKIMKYTYQHQQQQHVLQKSLTLR